MRPKDVLPDHANQTEINGVLVRKGTVGAFLANSRLWLSTDTPASIRAELERDILESVAALKALGLFEVLQVKDERLQQLIAPHI
jgi:hypothetical protein